VTAAAPQPPLLTQLAQADGLLEESLATIPDEIEPNALETPVGDRPVVPWPIESEYDAMAVCFRIAQLRARAAWAHDMAKQIERDAASQEARIVYAIGGRTFREGGKDRVGYGQLEDWARAHLPRGKKSVKIPAGTLAFRAAPSLLSVPPEREAALLAWCKEYAPHWVETVEVVRKADIKAHIEETGEVPADANGEQLVEFLKAGRHDLFSFKPADGAEALPAARPHAKRLEESAQS